MAHLPSSSKCCVGGVEFRAYLVQPPKFYKRTIHRRPGFSPAKSLFSRYVAGLKPGLHRILFLYPPYFQTASCPLPHTGLRFPSARCGGKIRSAPHPAAKPQKSRPKRAAGDLTVMAAGLRRQFARGGARGAFFSAHAAGGLWRRAACLRRDGRRAGRRGRRARQGRMRRRQSGRRGFFVGAVLDKP